MKYSIFRKTAATLDPVRDFNRKAEDAVERGIDGAKSKLDLDHSWSQLGGRTNRDLLWDVGGGAVAGFTTYILAKLLGASKGTAAAAGFGGFTTGTLATDIARHDTGRDSWQHNLKSTMNSMKRKGINGFQA